jgi:hypothetical protein
VAHVVTAPAWVAPVKMGCEVRQRVRTQPSEGLAPGEAPRTVVEATLDTTCRPSGSAATVVDDPSYDDARLFVGSCAQGFTLSTRSAKLATVAFATPADCDAFAALRASSMAGTAKRRLRTVLRLDALTPEAAFTVTSFSEAPDASNYAVTDGS